MLPHEAQLHDEWSASVDINSIDVYSVMESANAVENAYILDCINYRMNGLSGLRVLDIGAGLGESSVYFALKGADVTAVDGSGGMIEVCNKLAERYGVGGRVATRVSPVETAELAAGYYDVIYAANIIHHVHDEEAFIANCHSWLRPGGLFFSIDPLRYNPVINVYRRMAADVRSESEEPVGFEILGSFRKHFRSVGHREFWLLSLMLFLKYYFVDRLDPNRVRYWKRIYGDMSGLLRRVMTMLHALDRLLLKLPLLNRLAWNIVVVAEK